MTTTDTDRAGHHKALEIAAAFRRAAARYTDRGPYTDIRRTRDLQGARMWLAVARSLRTEDN